MINQIKIDKMQISIQAPCKAQSEVQIPNNIVLNFRLAVQTLFNVSQDSYSFESLNQLSVEEMTNLFQIYYKKYVLKRLLVRQSINKFWRSEEALILKNLVQRLLVIKKYQNSYELNDSDWNNISKCLFDKTAEDCKFKFFSFLDNRLNIKNWTPEENQILKRLIEDPDQANWSDISKKLYQECQSLDKVYRSARQCKQNFYNNLDPRLKKGTWTMEQDLTIINLYKKHGKVLKQFNKVLQNRSNVSIRNRFLHLQRVFQFDRQESNCRYDLLKVQLITNFM